MRPPDRILPAETREAPMNKFNTYRAGAEDYVRFEAEGKTGRIFLQPMFRRN